jgi:ADP-heptose:LPS heptosyltransferase
MCLGAFQAIRAHHPAAELVLLTTRPYAGLAEASGHFDAVWCDSRPRPLDVAGWMGLIRKLRGGGFGRIYDLQLSQRSAWYFRLLGPRRPEWVGVVPGCSHRYVPPPEPKHIMARHAEMLKAAGIARVPPPNLSFLTAFALPPRTALLVPGSSPHRQVKRWPAERYAELAKALAARGVTPVVIGGTAERAAARKITAVLPEARDLCGETGLAELAELARGATLAVGNDTGPLHLAAMAGAPVVALYCRESDPVKARPPGQRVALLRRDSLQDLPLAEVVEAVDRLLASA